MDGNNKKMELLGNTPVPKALLAMGIPIMLGMMVNAIYNLVDAYFVSGLGTSQMGAISVVFPLGQVVVGLGLLYGNGAASYLSRLLGKKQHKEADMVASTALYGSIGTGAVLIIIAVIFLRPILYLLGATESIMQYAVTYAGIYIISCIFNVFNVTMNNIVTSEGAARTSMCALIIGAVLNIVLDPVCIYAFGLGVAGAAIATAISQFMTTVVYLQYILSRKSMFHFHVKDCCFSRKVLTEIFKIGVPTLFFQVLTSLSISLTNMRSNTYGDSVIAGMGAVTRLISMGSLVIFGFLKGFQPIAGYSYGAKKYDRLYEAIRTAIRWSTIVCVIYGIVMALFAPAIISKFTSGDALMIQTGVNALRANGITFMLFGYCTVYSCLFLSLGKGKEGFILGSLRQGICFVPIILVLPLFRGVDGILYAQPIADVLTLIVTLFMSIRIHKELTVAKN